MVKSLGCGIVVREFELQFHFMFIFGQILLRKVWTLYPISYSLNCITAVLLEEWFGIRLPVKVDMPLNKKKPNQSYDDLSGSEIE